MNIRLTIEKGLNRAIEMQAHFEGKEHLNDQLAKNYWEGYRDGINRIKDETLDVATMITRLIPLLKAEELAVLRQMMYSRQDDLEKATKQRLLAD